MKRAALYVRVSTAEQRDHGLSVDSQIVALKQYCEENNMIVSGIYNDAGISARKKYKNRPALLQMLKDCETGKIDIILTTRTDRFFRSVADFYEVQAKLEEYKVPFRTIWEDYETETAAGTLKFNILLSVSQAESDRTSEKIKSVFAHQRAKGDYVGKKPFGYVRQNHRLVANSEQKEIVDTLFDTYLKTFSVSSVYKKMQSIGHPMSKSGICYMLKNPAYCADVDGVDFAYITKEQHESILRWMQNYTHHTDNQHKYIFSGLLTCAYCGARMNTGRSHDHRTDKTYYNYNCWGKSNIATHEESFSINELKFEKIMVDCIDSLIEQENSRRFSINNSDDDHEKEIEKLKQKRKRLINLYADGDIEQDEYREKRDAVNRQISQLEIIKPNMEQLTLPESWKSMYYDLTDENKRRFWRSCIKNIVISKESRNGIDFSDIEFI